MSARDNWLLYLSLFWKISHKTRMRYPKNSYAHKQPKKITYHKKIQTKALGFSQSTYCNAHGLKWTVILSTKLPYFQYSLAFSCHRLKINPYFTINHKSIWKNRFSKKKVQIYQWAESYARFITDGEKKTQLYLT